MIRPTRQTFTIGQDAYGRLVELTMERASDGKETWTITIHAHNQRDDTQRIMGLTAENLTLMAQAAKGGTP